MVSIKPDEKLLIEDINKKKTSGKLSRTTLQTDDRVLARITDGIYRQPSSALRELVSNAYDADATEVVINTDAPRFQQITVRDNGNGMDVEALARLIFHIGGSSKRRLEGAEYKTTTPSDPTRSPGGRRLIGKIGIGLFSVAQLTRHFQIVTKVKGNNFRLIAEVTLKNYNEDIADQDGDSGESDSGDVLIRTVTADDLESHGTEIVLLDLRPRTVDILRSRALWESINEPESEDAGTLKRSEVPAFHIGVTDPSTGLYTTNPILPWTNETPPDERFSLLFDGMVDEIERRSTNPKLEDSLDNYFQIIWNLSLAVPVDYLGKHPFDLRSLDIPVPYYLKPFQRGRADKMELGFGETIRQHLKLKSPERGKRTPEFRVTVDQIELKRPIRFDVFPKSRHAIKTPLIFVGRAAPDLAGIPKHDRGGDLEFEAYFLWSPKVVPRENAGLLIRIGDASGTLFDETFAKYQVSESTRLRQITAEIFVTKGLDPAINIDRESFNYSHPHYQYLTTWVHRALRQIANTLKFLGEQVALESKREISSQQISEIGRIVGEAVEKAAGKDVEVADVELSTSNVDELAQARKEGKLALNHDAVFVTTKKSRGTNQNFAKELFEQQIKAVAQVLEAYDLLSTLTYEQQEELLRTIVQIFSVER